LIYYKSENRKIEGLTLDPFKGLVTILCKAYNNHLSINCSDCNNNSLFGNTIDKNSKNNNHKPFAEENYKID